MAERAPVAANQSVPPARTYRADILVRFAHCDPAGIVFFPRYMEMFNNLVEDWCREELGFSFAEIHSGRGWGLPTVHLEVDFMAPSVVGEVLSATVAVRSLGTDVDRAVDPAAGTRRRRSRPCADGASPDGGTFSAADPNSGRPARAALGVPCHRLTLRQRPLGRRTGRWTRTV